MANKQHKSARNLGPESFPEIEAASADGACGISARPTIGDDDDWLGDAVQDAVAYAGDHRESLMLMMR